MGLSFDHVHIICKDSGKMVAFFEDIFGGEVIYQEENFHGAPNAVVCVGEARLFLRGVRPGESIGENHPEAVMGLDHFSFAVDDIHGLAAQMKEAGAQTSSATPPLRAWGAERRPTSGGPRTCE